MEGNNYFSVLTSNLGIVVISIAVTSYAKKENTEELARIAELDQTIAEKDKLAQGEAKKAALVEEARQLAEAKAAIEAAAQREKLAEIAALKASEEAAQRMSEALLLEAEKQAAKLTAGRKASEEKAVQQKALRARETTAAAAKFNLC